MSVFWSYKQVQFATIANSTQDGDDSIREKKV